MVTGGNSGIGYATALQIGQLGARVTIVGRHAGRTQAAAERLRQSGCLNIETQVCDVSDLTAVDALADSLEAVDVLIHNAGDMIHELSFTSAGVEQITATHVVGPYRLTRRLCALGKLKSAEIARVIFVSSGGMYTQPLDVSALSEFGERYDGVTHYAQTKRAQVALARMLDEESRSGGRIRFAAMHPGWVDTPALKRAMPTFKRLTHLILRRPAEGADTVVWLALCDINHWAGDTCFYFDRKPVEVHLMRKTRARGDDPAVLKAFLDQFIDFEQWSA